MRKSHKFGVGIPKVSKVPKLRKPPALAKGGTKKFRKGYVASLGDNTNLAMHQGNFLV